MAQDRKSIEVFRKNDEGRWVLFEADPDRGTVELASVGCVLALEQVYTNGTFVDDAS